MAADMPNIDIRDFPAVSAADLSDFVVLSLFSGTSARMSVGLFRSSVTQGIRPYIGEGGYWYVGEASTDVLAEGRTPELRKTSTSIEYKYTSEGDDSWRPLVHFSDLRLQFDDLTPEQYELLKLKPEDLTPEDIALLQKPALDTIDRLEQTERDMIEAETARKDAENLRSEEFASLKQDMEDAVAHTQQAAESAEDTAQHPTRIGEDNYVYTWNKLTREYERTDIYVKGDRGEGGPEPVIEYGTTTTLEPGEDASAELLDKGLDEEGRPVYLLSLSIPKGDKGESGEGTGNVLVAEEGLLASRTYLFQPSSDGSAEGRFVEYAVPDIDISSFVTGEQLSEALKGKQDVVDDLDSIREGASKGATALQEEQYKGTVTGVKVNGSVKSPSGGLVDLGTLLTSHQDISGKQDKSLFFTGLTASRWYSDSTHSGYPYRCDVSCQGVSSSMFAEVVFGIGEATSGDYAPVCETGTNRVRIWSKKNVSITIPTIIITK